MVLLVWVNTMIVELCLHCAIPLQIDNKNYVFLFFMANEEYKNLRELQQFLLYFFFLNFSLGCIYPQFKTKYKRLHLKKKTKTTKNAKRLETTLKF